LVCAIAIVFYIGFVLGPILNIWWFQDYTAPLWIVVPVVVGVWVLAGLGLWLGWIMTTTKEVSPPMSEPEKEKKPAKTKKK
jgi:uncharacterized membrane protein YciS (DUF1049 family)